MKIAHRVSLSDFLRNRSRRTALRVLILAGVLMLSAGAGLQARPVFRVNPDLYAGLRWRNVGPFHGGRASAVTGVIGEPNVFYFGAPQGGVWKTTSAGVRWHPIFDRVRRVDSIGAVAVAPSDPNIVYVGTGDPIHIGVVGNHGDGVWKSTNAGKTWRHVGLDNTISIVHILIDPKNPNVVIAAALGDANHPGGGVYRTTNGGKTWTRVLDPLGYTGIRQLTWDDGDPRVVLAVTQGTNVVPSGLGLKKKTKPQHKPKPPLLFESTDGGLKWKTVKIPPLTGRIGVAVARHGRLLYLVGPGYHKGSGLFRSNNGGRTWRHMAAHDTRIQGGEGGYFGSVYVDPQNPRIVYVLNTATYRSTNGGVTFHAFKGAPGGEDYHVLWIDPRNGKRMIIGADQGASVSLNGGRTWSLWYTEPIAQIYHLATTAQYPYWIVGSQQDTGAVMIASRGNMGQVDITDWKPNPSSEFGYIATDPLDPHIMYGIGYGPGGGGSGIIKINTRTGQWENVAPNFGVNARKYHESGSDPMAFDPFDPHALYAAFQCLMVTTNGGHSWTVVSPDLTTPKGKPQVRCGTSPAPAKKKVKGKASSLPSPFGTPPPVIRSFSLSRAKRGVIWTVSTNNQIYRTTDGGRRWTNVSNITGAPPHTELFHIVAGDHSGTAYVTGRILVQGHGFFPTVPRHEDSNVPLIWRTRNGGKTWTLVVNGLPRNQRTGSWVNVVRVDPRQPRLLFAGTETTVYVSFDRGNHWQSLRQNLPSTSIRDLLVHTADHQHDLVICTYGRGFWVLDDFTPLEEIAAHPRRIASSRAYLFKPETAIRARENSNWDQPFSVEVPSAPNPPYGVIVDYELRRVPKGPVELRIYNDRGRLVRTYTSVLPPPIEGQKYPRYWLATPASRALPKRVGLNRFAWNLRYAPPPAFAHDLENQMNVVPGTVTPGPHGPQVIPGVYTLKLLVDGRTYTRHVTVVNDPRVGQSPRIMADLRAQNRLSMRAYEGMTETYEGHHEADILAAELAVLIRRPHLPPAVAKRAKALLARVRKIGGGKPKSGFLAYIQSHRPMKPKALRSFLILNDRDNDLVSMMQVGYDMAPTTTQVATWINDCRHYDRTVNAWKDLLRVQLTRFNALLEKDQLPKLRVPAVEVRPRSCNAHGLYVRSSVRKD
jgi:photosystem II stability/assembly factor-like uncharacterized protein